MADKVVGLEIRSNGEQVLKSVGSIKQELRNAQQEALSLAREFVRERTLKSSDTSNNDGDN
jgi:hypothetical protein